MLYAWFRAMHTRIDLMLCDSHGETELSHIAEAVRDELLRIESIANRYDPDSELARLNRTAHISPQPVSAELYGILDLCLEAYRLTSGCFDITVLSSGYKPGDIDQIRLSAEDHTLFYSRRGISVDLSGFLKGYALDKIRGLLLQYGIYKALINMGNSSILAIGNTPDDTGWRVRFAPDSALSDSQNHKIILNDECLTTSGNSSSDRQHIISPATGRFITGRREIAVVTPYGTTGEILSTALFAADSDCRRQILSRFAPRLFITSD